MLEIPEINLNPITTVYEVSNGSLTKNDTHDKPVTKSTSWNIASEQAAIDKINGVIAKWQDKKKVHQDVIDKYNEEVNK